MKNKNSHKMLDLLLCLLAFGESLNASVAEICRPYNEEEFFPALQYPYPFDEEEDEGFDTFYDALRELPPEIIIDLDQVKSDRMFRIYLNIINYSEKFRNLVSEINRKNQQPLKIFSFNENEFDFAAHWSIVDHAVGFKRSCFTELTDEELGSLLIFEMANGSQEDLFNDLYERAKDGEFYIEGDQDSKEASASFARAAEAIETKSSVIHQEIVKEAIENGISSKAKEHRYIRYTNSRNYYEQDSYFKRRESQKHIEYWKSVYLEVYAPITKIKPNRKITNKEQYDFNDRITFTVDLSSKLQRNRVEQVINRIQKASPIFEQLIQDVNHTLGPDKVVTIFQSPSLSEKVSWVKGRGVGLRNAEEMVLDAHLGSMIILNLLEGLHQKTYENTRKEAYEGFFYFPHDNDSTYASRSYAYKMIEIYTKIKVEHNKIVTEAIKNGLLEGNTELNSDWLIWELDDNIYKVMNDVLVHEFESKKEDDWQNEYKKSIAPVVKRNDEARRAKAAETRKRLKERFGINV